jgi:hypothetical protein
LADFGSTFQISEVCSRFRKYVPDFGSIGPIRKEVVYWREEHVIESGGGRRVRVRVRVKVRVRVRLRVRLRVRVRIKGKGKGRVKGKGKGKGRG